jgi:histidinol-phosphate aminotransferase
MPTAMTYARTTIAEMTGYVPGEQPRDRRYVKLNTNENPYPPSPRVSEALAALNPGDFRLYPDPVCSELCAAAAGLFDLPPDWALCGNGSDDLLTMAIRTFVDQGDRIAYPDPTYSLYPVLAQIQGADTIGVPLTDEFDLADDLTAAARGARLLFLARPNAPTGKACARAVVERVCREFGGIVWVDEAYADFADDHCVGLVREHANLIVSRTLSKSYSLAGIRLGFALAQPHLVQEMLKVKDSYNVNRITQALGLAALQDQAHVHETVARVRATRERVTAALAGLGFCTVPSQANFLFTAPPCAPQGLVRELRSNGILVRYFPGPRTGRFLRVSIGTDAEMDEFLTVCTAAVDKLPRITVP